MKNEERRAWISEFSFGLMFSNKLKIKQHILLPKVFPVIAITIPMDIMSSFSREGCLVTFGSEH